MTNRLPSLVAFLIAARSGSPTPVGRRLKALIAIVAISVACGSSPDSPSGSTRGPFSYSITGSAKHVSITYQNSSGGTNQTGWSLGVPFSYSGTAKSGDFLYISAQIDSSPDSGNITVTIMKNGLYYTSASAFGFPNIATASGSY